MGDKVKRFALTVYVSIVCGSSVQAQNTSGNELLAICKDSNLAAQGYCLGYVKGLIEGLKLGAAVPMMRINQEGGDTPIEDIDRLSSEFLGFCLPEEAELSQFHDLIIGYLERTPQDRHGSARLLGQIALAEAYPCQ